MRLIYYVNFQDNYVDMKHVYINIRDNYVNMWLKLYSHTLQVIYMVAYFCLREINYINMQRNMRNNYIERQHNLKRMLT